jgi:hypothetical protein
MEGKLLVRYINTEGLIQFGLHQPISFDDEGLPVFDTENTNIAKVLSVQNYS